MTDASKKPIMQELITKEQKINLRGIFKNEDEIYPDGYIQIWIPNDFNRFATVIGWKRIVEGKEVLVAGFNNPFAETSEAVLLPAEEYKYWCELPKFTEEMIAQSQKFIEDGLKGIYKYPYPGLRDK